MHHSLKILHWLQDWKKIYQNLFKRLHWGSEQNLISFVLIAKFTQNMEAFITSDSKKYIYNEFESLQFYGIKKWMIFGWIIMMKMFREPSYNEKISIPGLNSYYNNPISWTFECLNLICIENYIRRLYMISHHVFTFSQLVFSKNEYKWYNCFQTH